jgi:hypothetical protein
LRQPRRQQNDFGTQLFFVLLLVFSSQAKDEISTLNSIERIKAKVSVESLATADKPRLAGLYTNPPKDLVRRIGGVLSGDELYLFPDGTFIYCEWADVQPLTIYDKGQWTFTNRAIELKSDADVTWDPKVDRTYLAVRRQSHRNEILLVGVHTDLPYFEQEARDDPETMLLIVSKGRRSKLTPNASERIKEKLFRQSWRPDDFMAKPADHDEPRR